MSFLQTHLRLAAALASAALLTAPSVGAQSIVTGPTGTEFRYLGDTIWMSRDTTMTRVILRGDTATRTRFVHGTVVSSATYVQRGDFADQIAGIGADGESNMPTDARRPTPVAILTSERQMLESAIRSEQMQARMAGMSRGLPTADASPAAPREYRVSPNTRIVQHRDTVRYIRGCTAAPPVDTTVYVLFGADSVQRRSPDPRSFDRHMVSAIRQDMNASLLRERSAELPGGGATASLPSLPSLATWVCDVR